MQKEQNLGTRLSSRTTVPAITSATSPFRSHHRSNLANCETLASMAPEKMTEYERQRLENIRRNEEMMAALRIQSKLSQLSAATQQKKDEEKSYRRSGKKRIEPETPIVVRRSLRARGLPPDASTAKGLQYDETEIKDHVKLEVNKQPERWHPKSSGPISMSEAYSSDHSDKPLIQRILGLSEDGVNPCVQPLDLGSLSLEPDNVARLMPGRILALQFSPSNHSHIIASGNTFGEIAFWDVDSGHEEGGGLYLYRPFSSPVSGIVFQPNTPSKVYTSCYSGLIRLMDAEKEVFDMIHSAEYGIFSLAQRPGSDKCVTFGDGSGTLSVFDESMGKFANSWSVHENKINSIDYNLVNPHLVATSSTDRTACIWDLRKIVKDKPKPLKIANHKRSVQSAYFSPSGSCLATTSLGNRISFFSGDNYEEEHMMYHFHETGRWLSTFKGIWGWDDSYVFIGNMKKKLDVVCATSKKVVKTLTSENMTAIPCRFAKHPSEVGMIAGATSGGQVYLWTSSS
uniref:WD repeat-containing protein 76 n=1 Tax=Kalanchoe fedtschenkoi TaxID=63787 RepID=A0A7N0RAE3_KALFE